MIQVFLAILAFWGAHAGVCAFSAAGTSYVPQTVSLSYSKPFSPQKILAALKIDLAAMQTAPFVGRTTFYQIKGNSTIDAMFADSSVSLQVFKEGEKTLPYALIVTNSEGNVESYLIHPSRNRDIETHEPVRFQREVNLPGFDTMHLVAPASVYLPPRISLGWTPDYSLDLLTVAFQNITPKTRKILILGGGGGYDAIAIAKETGLTVDVIDLDPKAVETIKVNARLHGVEGKVNAFQSDLFTKVTGKYDLILFNAPRPLIAGLSGMVLRPKANAALFDPEGKVVERVFRYVPDYLNDDGKLILMSDRDIGKFLPSPLNIVNSSPQQPWNLTDGVHGYYSVHEIQVLKP